MFKKKYDAKLDQIKGNLKEGSEKVTGDKKLEAEDFAEKTIAEGKELASDVEESAEGAIEGVKEALHKGN